MIISYVPNEYSQQRQHEKKTCIWPVLMAMEFTKMLKDGHEVYWDEHRGPDLDIDKAFVDKVVTEPEGLPFLELPHPLREFTDASNPKYQRNGNFKHHPGTYIQSASGCWHGECSFCVEKGKPYELRPVDDVIEEIRECKVSGFREVFDDAATFAGGDWLKEFCVQLKPMNMHFSCNMRFGELKPQDYKMMKDAGFRMILYGLESANQHTLNKINKGIHIDQAIEELKLADMCGLEPHICVIFGYPWETDEDAKNTLKLVHFLLRKGYARTAQASLYMPPVTSEGYGESPGLRALNTKFEHKKYIPKIYHAAFYPDFWFNKLTDIKNLDDLKYIWRGIQSCFGI